MPVAQTTGSTAEIHGLPAVRLRDALRAGEVSAREITAHFLDRIAAQNPLLGAFVTITAEQAMADAAAADARYVRFRKDLGHASADSATDVLPPLHGMPVAFKDLTDVAGVVTTHGSAALDHKPAPADGALAAV
ncbi:MAG TPA: amidase family protein, partial [Arthrobacter sp.]|nr:amidase family protein [Arthrobacter sp.]